MVRPASPLDRARVFFAEFRAVPASAPRRHVHFKQVRPIGDAGTVPLKLFFEIVEGHVARRDFPGRSTTHVRRRGSILTPIFVSTTHGRSMKPGGARLWRQSCPIWAEREPGLPRRGKSWPHKVRWPALLSSCCSLPRREVPSLGIDRISAGPQ